jgi:hypothetical protein
MNARIETQNLMRLCAHYQNMVDLCADAIKQLTGHTPENFTFVFAINETPIVTIPIGEEDGSFCVGVFMSWHQFYSRKHKETAAILMSLTAKIAV